MTLANALDVRRGPARAVGTELAGVLGALVLALVAVGHVAASGRAFFLFYDGDSELLPLMREAVLAGGPLHFALSTGLVFPELGLYLVCAAFATSVQGAITINAVVNVVIFYGLVRAIAGQSAPCSSRARRVGLAIASLVVFTLLVLCETGTANNDFELFSMNLTGTYYLSTVIGTTATALLTMVAVGRTGSRRRILAAVGVGMVAAVSVTVSFIYVAWSVVPVFVALAGLVLVRRVRWRTVIAPAVALLIGVVVGLVLRLPLSPFISLTGLSYVHPLQVRLSLGSYAKSVWATVTGTPTGVVVIVAMMAMVALSVFATVLALKRRAPVPVLGFIAIASTTSVLVIVGSVALGQVATRYLLPAAILPVFMLPAVAVLLQWDRAFAAHTRVTAAAAAVLLAVGAVAAPVAAVHAVNSSRYTGSECLDRWLDGRDLVGAGQYWTVRAMNVYDPHARILQIQPTATIFAWLVDLDAYRVDAVSYVIVDHDAAKAGWGAALTGTFGAPAEVVGCPGYQIYSYEGAPGQTALTAAIVDSAEADRAGRGW